ncbi:hypothetical protein VSDG_08856 [Cytospora chrysosperma]|uniref:F-box domain-containing protein n=1 Tax=Cytospora chrysosperma TaxID=252740 RepID=A0A423VDT9_CYTCH|nr:hypothetical protein VSDG_08856 [Valsa sordida]
MAPTTFNSFFDLPGELREQILAYLLVKPEGIHINAGGKLELLGETSPERRIKSPPLSNDDSDDDRQERPGWPLNYFLVSQTFHREASAVFFGENKFYMYTLARSVILRGRGPGRRCWPEPGGRGRGSGSGKGGHGHEHGRGFKHLESLRRIRRVVLYAQRLGGVLESLFVPLLRDMTLAGGLKHLDVRVCPSRQGARGPASLWGSSPGRGLLDLLRDPDLDVARLRVCLDLLLPGGKEKGRSGEEVGEEDVAAWCPRREGPDGRLVTATDREGRVWCDMDVGELVRRYGGEEVGIFKVGEERSLLRWAAS